MRLLAVALTCALVATAAHAQAPAAPAPPGPSPTGLVVGSGNFFSPIVSELDRAVAFYRDGLGLARDTRTETRAHESEQGSLCALRSSSSCT